MTNSNLPSIGSKIVWSAHPDTVWVVDHHLPQLNQFEAHIEGKPLEGARFDLDQLEGSEIYWESVLVYKLQGAEITNS
jgi:hypothetical protein